MILRLFLLFTLVPITELWLLLRIGRAVGPPATLALVLGTGALGAWLAHREGLRAWARVREELDAGRLPGRQVLDALLVFVAGVVLLTPGFLTDLTGFFLLVPSGRRWVREWILWRWSRRRGRWRVSVVERGPVVDVRPSASGGEAGVRRRDPGKGEVIEISPDDVVVEPEDEDRGTV